MLLRHKVVVCKTERELLIVFHTEALPLGYRAIGRLGYTLNQPILTHESNLVFDHLGYPHYLLFILGAWKLPCAVALFVPRFPRLKEWAYAGAFFNYTGAAASHLLAGDGPNRWVGPFVFAVITLASWALRPPERRASISAPTNTRAVAWIVPLAAIAAFLVVALLTLPKGPPSQ